MLTCAQKVMLGLLTQADCDTAYMISGFITTTVLAGVAAVLVVRMFQKLR